MTTDNGASDLARRICKRHAEGGECPLWKIIDEEVEHESLRDPLGVGFRNGLTPSQQVFISGLEDGQWHTYGGRKSAMINRLGDAGFVQFRYHPRAPGMPERVDARLTPDGETSGHVAF